MHTHGNVKPSHGGHGGYLLASHIVPARPGMVEMAKWVKRLLAACHPQRHDVLAIGHDDWLTYPHKHGCQGLLHCSGRADRGLEH